MFKEMDSKDYKIVSFEDLCNLELDCCYIRWEGLIYFCSSAIREDDELILNGEDGEGVVSLSSQSGYFVLLEYVDKDEDGCEDIILDIVEVII